MLVYSVNLWFGIVDFSSVGKQIKVQVKVLVNGKLDTSWHCSSLFSVDLAARPCLKKEVLFLLCSFLFLVICSHCNFSLKLLVLIYQWCNVKSSPPWNRFKINRSINNRTVQVSLLDTSFDKWKVVGCVHSKVKLLISVVEVVAVWKHIYDGHLFWSKGFSDLLEAGY